MLLLHNGGRDEVPIYGSGGFTAYDARQANPRLRTFAAIRVG